MLRIYTVMNAPKKDCTAEYSIFFYINNKMEMRDTYNNNFAIIQESERNEIIAYLSLRGRRELGGKGISSSTIKQVKRKSGSIETLIKIT